MPTDSIFVALGVSLMFLVFAFVLAWADRSTTQWLRERDAERQAPAETTQVDRKAA